MKHCKFIILLLITLGSQDPSYSFSQGAEVQENKHKQFFDSSIVSENRMLKAVIFDIGNVFVNVNLDIWGQEFRKLGVEVSQDILKNDAVRNLINEYQEGKISSSDFIKQLSHKMGVEEIPVQKFEVVWNSVILSLFEESMNILKVLHSDGYQIFALSDTNEMHAKFIEDLYQKSHPSEFFFKVFDKSYLSHLTGNRKSNNEAWLQILSEQKLKPGECIFIDDLHENIEKARNLGIHVFLYGPKSNMKVVYSRIKEINHLNLQ